MGTTKIDWDVDYFSRFVDHDPTADPGLGLFQNTDGMFDLPVIGPNIVSILKKNLHPLQKRYSMESGYDEDYVICPTTQSIMERVLVYMNPLTYAKVGSWCVRKNVLVIKNQKVNKKLSFENHPEKFDPLEVVHFRGLESRTTILRCPFKKNRSGVM